MRAIKDLNFSATPGLGQFRNYTSIGQALGWNFFCFENKINLKLLKALVTRRMKALISGTNVPTPVKMFIKEEPLSQKKKAEGRARLIFALSLEDQVVDKILFGPWHDVEQLNSSVVPNKVGWSPVPEGFWLVKRDFPIDDYLPLATDCSAFDWTLPPWTIPLIIDQKLEQADEYFPDYERAVRARIKEVLGTDCLVRFPNGSCMRQSFDGLMKSGWLLTISFNGWSQFFINALAWLRLYPSKKMPVIWTMGDDVLMSWSDKYDQEAFENQLKKTGILVKRGVRAREFSGFRFSPDDEQFWVDPLYADKHKFQLRHYTEHELKSLVDSYACIYSLASPSCSSWFEPVRRKYGTRTPVWYKAWAWGLPLSGFDLIRTSDFEF